MILASVEQGCSGLIEHIAELCDGDDVTSGVGAVCCCAANGLTVGAVVSMIERVKDAESDSLPPESIVV